MFVKIDAFGIKKKVKQVQKGPADPTPIFYATLTFFVQAQDGGTRGPVVGLAGQIVKTSETLKYQNRQKPYSWKLFGEPGSTCTKGSIQPAAALASASPGVFGGRSPQ